MRLLCDDVFIGPNATLTNDVFPRSRRWSTGVPMTLIRQGASMGANSTLLPDLTIGSHALVGADSDTGLHMLPMTWDVQYRYSPDPALLVLASDSYDADDSFRDYDEFIRLVRRGDSQ
jgi:hypothetical protein